MQPLSDLRQDYAKASLDIQDVSKDPMIQFEKWFQEALAAKVLEPNAMNLATVNEDGRPTARIVLLKGIENQKFTFFTNYQSLKGRELEKNPACALTFFWPELERQVRIEGIAERVTAEASQAYFQSRPRSSQIGAWSSPQSSIIENRQILEERVAQMEKKFSEHQVLPRPNQWGGFAVTPLVIEFWQGRPSRLHDRLQFTRVDGLWKVHRLAP
ncbi:pyridoxamine 5'-phosphate oxidase [Pseudochryseolinea flava]|uniref:Pyridoxine/pyridoxamine 5'-phosphate oxidase n=1 Tax=Pseudochryseolinea flava TaxID=2059302 RepID=A0A364XUQ5_9BACT|nr:pyridoxamine 5'-phosphate oxidase [Pseudochryseolinea flava]RAV98031.1 pyridoxamine 5'-phosphate oxidase [Pseudochryseolinea flava]